jgi:hypothetical protein
MDISAITDLNELKALAYDQLVLKEQAEHNLQLLNQRIAEINKAAQATPPPQNKK